MSVAVIFELWPAAEGPGRYLDIAAGLAAALGQVDGFVSVERFESMVTPGKLMSLSFWSDEAAVAAWRDGADHRAAQTLARAGVLRDYRLRVAVVVRDYGMDDRDAAPADSRARLD